MPVTIRDVAKHLNLSITTVSRALDGYDDVAEQTRARVIQAAHELGYAPSRAARQLRRQRTDALGYILPVTTPRFADPFFSEFIAGLGDETASHGFDLLVSTAPPGEAAEQAIYRRWVMSRQVDGMILSRMRLEDWRVRFLHKSNFPFIVLGHCQMPINFPLIEVDGRSGFKTLVAHMVARGHARIAYIGASPELTLQADRFTGYQEGLEAAGIPYEAALVAEGNLTRDGGYRAAQQLLDLPNPPTAIVAVNDLAAIGAMSAARERGLEVGRDLAIAGFDGIEDSKHTQPPLTTLNQPVYEIARRLVSMLLKLIKDEPLTEQQIVLEPELIVRASTGG